MIMNVCLFLALLFLFISCNSKQAAKKKESRARTQETVVLSESSREVISRVKDGVALFKTQGEKAFETFRIPNSRWRTGDDYIFVIDDLGNMLVHADSTMEGKNVLDLKDIGGKSIIKGLLNTALQSHKGQGGWYHYQWPTPGGLFPRWKSSFVMPVTSPAGRQYVLGCGIYTDRMEKEFVVDMVNAAAKEIESKGDSAFSLFYDPTGSYRNKDAYVVVFSRDGIDLVNPAFPDLEGRNVMDLKDVNGKLIVTDMFKVANEKGSGWVEYMWPKPGQSVPTMKSTYVTKAKYKGKEYLVSCGTYLGDAPRAAKNPNSMSAAGLMNLVNDAAKVFAKKGEDAYPEFRQKGGKWYRDNTYFFVWTTNGIRKFHAANPELEGQNVNQYTDAIGRKMGQMMLDAGRSASGAGWVHYMHPEPGSYFPIWKSSYVKKVRFPDGKDYIIGCGVYNMDMDEAIIEDLVGKAASLVEEKGKSAFPQLRDKKGPFVFMDTYIFMVGTDGTELFNAGLPTLEGTNNMDMKDLKGKTLIRDEIALAMKEGEGWLDGYWYTPGDNQPALKRTFVKKVSCDGKMCIIGSGYYPQQDEK